MVVRVAVAVAVLVDVLDLVAMDRVDVADAPVIAAGAAPVLDAAGAAAVMVDVAKFVMDAEHHVTDALGALDLVKDVLGVQDVEDIVQPHAHQAVKDHLVVHAIVALAVLVHVHHVHHAADALDLVVALGALDATVLAAGATPVLDAAGAKDIVNRSVQLDVWVAVDVQEDAVLDAMAHVLEHATGVVMGVAVSVKTHALPHVQQRVLAPVKLKHLAPQYLKLRTQQ